LMIGFHGCDLTVRNELVNNPDTIRISEKNFDWLGHGFYVWENNYERALHWANEKKKRRDTSKDFNPSVVGIFYQLEYCLDFTDSHFINLLPTYYNLFKAEMLNVGNPLPTNNDIAADVHKDRVLRELDCAVIEYLHNKIDEARKIEIQNKRHSEIKRFDTVRGIFTEGGPVFEGAGIQAKNHIQVCIKNLNCIKGFFIPRKAVPF
jgi:hypothetical protein